MKKKIIKIHETDNGQIPFWNWVNSLDKFHRDRILTRINRLENGNKGDSRALGDGVFELKFHFSSGYRVYYGEYDEFIILLLCGGDKSSQSRDIKKAKIYFNEYREK